MKKPTILLGVTADVSLTLMRGFPEFLSHNGWSVHVVSGPGPNSDALRQTDGIFVHTLDMKREPSPIADLRSLIAWFQLLGKVKPDVVSVGTPKAGLLGGLAAWLRRSPHRVYLLRGLRLETETGVKRRVLHSLERISMRVAHDVIAVSASLRERAIALRLVAPEKIRVLGAGSSNGVQVDDFMSGILTATDLAALVEQLEVEPAIPVIGFVGRLTRDKGLEQLTQARELLTERGIDHQLLLVGGIDDDKSSDVVERLRTAGRPAILVGHVTDPRPYYQLMDVLCLPTLREGFPNVVLESAAAGVPTVTTNATGAIDSVIDGVTGIVVEAGSGQSLANGLADALSRDLAEMGIRARERVERDFARADVWHRTERHYRSLLSADSSSAGQTRG